MKKINHIPCKKQTAPAAEGQERLWRRFDLTTRSREETEELYRVLDKHNLTRHELAVIVMGLRARPEFSLADFQNPDT